MLNCIAEIFFEMHGFDPLYNNEIEMEQIGWQKVCHCEEMDEIASQLDKIAGMNETPDGYQYLREFAPDGLDDMIRVYWPSDKRALWLSDGKGGYGTPQ